MDNTLRTLVDLRDRTLQKSRIAFANRIEAIENGLDTDVDDMTMQRLERWLMVFSELETVVDKEIRELALRYPIIQHMIQVKGIAEILASKTVSLIDIERAQTVSALWCYSGYGVTEGKADRPIKGQRLRYNKRLKATMFVVATSLMKANSPYKKIYDDSREYYDVHRLDWTNNHKHRASSRKMIKTLLAHLWVQWRTLEDLPVRNLYVKDYLGHTNYKPGTDYGWPAL
jgi:hypothetical protein